MGPARSALPAHLAGKGGQDEIAERERERPSRVQLLGRPWGCPRMPRPPPRPPDRTCFSACLQPLQPLVTHPLGSWGS